MTNDSIGPRLIIDRIACDGAGLCAHLAPEVIELDRWGFPVFDEVGDDAGGRAIEQARRAVRACPQRALHLVDQSSSSSS